MSKQTQIQQSEIKKAPFDQAFICPKCSEILFAKINYFENSNIPQVQFTCPQKHAGTVDLSLFFELFYSSNKEIENELSKFDEELEKDIELYKNKKLNEDKKNEEENKSKEKDNNNIELNLKLFKELQICNVVKFTLLKNKKNDIKKKKSKDKKVINHKINNNLNIKKIHSSEKEEKLKEEKFFCEIHNKRHFIGYCLSCKKNICKKCLKSKKHKSKMFKHMKINEKIINELNNIVGQCQESLNKFEKKYKILIEGLNNIEEREEKTILYIMSKSFLDINKEYLDEVKLIIKNYNNNVKNKMLNYETIMSVKKIKIKNNIIIPNDIQELINIIKDYKEYLLEKPIYSGTNNNNNKYILFETFNEIIKNETSENDKDIIKFNDIIQNEKFRNLINYKNNINEIENIDENEKEIHEVEKIDYDMNDFEEGDEDMEELLGDEEEDYEEYDDEYEDDDDDINNDEDENNYGDDEDGYKDEEDKEQ